MIKKVIIIPDAHISTTVPKEYKIIKEFIKKQKFDEIVILGDYMDVSALSAWDMDKKLLMEGRRYTKEVETTNKELDYLQKHCNKITYLGGNHPYHKDTEVLTSKGWKSISTINMSDELAQFNQDSIEISYSKPNALQKVYTEDVAVFENNYTKQVVNLEHMVFYNKLKIKAKDLVNTKLTKLGFEYFGDFKSNLNVNLSQLELEYLTWIIMDGCLVFKNNKPHHIQFKLSKKKKIKELESLMTKLGIQYTIKPSKKTGVNILQPYILRIYTDSKKYFKLLNNEKTFPEWVTKLNETQLKTILKTISITDGYKHFNQIVWSTINKINVDRIMIACIHNNIPFNYKEGVTKSGFKNGELQYLCKFHLNLAKFNSNALQSINTTIEPYNDYCYCATMPEGTLITRFDGRVAFSGNCSRVDRYVEKHPEMQGLIETPIVLNLKERGIQWIPYHSRKYYKIGKLWFHHGLYTNDFHTKKNLIALGANIVTGHLHRPQSYMLNMKMQKPIMAYSLGCLCEKEPDYLKGKPSNHMSGFGVMYYNTKTKIFNLYPINIIHNKFIWEGVEYGL